MFLAFGVTLILVALIGFVILIFKMLNNMKGPRVLTPGVSFDDGFDKHLDLMKVGAVLAGVFIMGVVFLIAHFVT